MKENLRRIPSGVLMFIGWAIFLFQLFLPMEAGTGQPLFGINLVWGSFVYSALLFEAFGSIDATARLGLLRLLGLGLCNFLVLISPALLRFKGRMIKWARNIMIVATLYVCTSGLFLLFQNYPLLYGYFVWCLSFVVVTVALAAKAEQEF